MSEASRTVEMRITDYLCSGGLFNPELANHDAVRDLLIDARDALTAERERADRAKAEGIKEGMRAAAEICRKGVGVLKADGFHVAAYEVTERIAAILAEADK